MKIVETGDFKELVPVFEGAGLEMRHEGDCPSTLITCWKAYDEKDDPAGGITIENRKGYYIIGDIAVKEERRHEDIATEMAKVAMARLKEMGVKDIYLVAKAPEFFETLGFFYLTPEETPEIFNCKRCEQRGVDCFPEFMKFEYR